MKKDKKEEYIEMGIFIIGAVIFSGIMYFAFQFGYAIVKSIF